MELAVYGDDGKLVTGIFMDYAMPRAAAAAPFEIANVPGVHSSW